MFFTFPFSYSWLKEWKLRADREERKKQTDKKLEEGSNGKELIKIYITVILLLKNKSLLLNITTSVDLECVCSYSCWLFGSRLRLGLWRAGLPGRRGHV